MAGIGYSHSVEIVPFVQGAGVENFYNSTLLHVETPDQIRETKTHPTALLRSSDNWSRLYTMLAAGVKHTWRSGRGEERRGWSCCVV